jgi:FAD synthetase
LSRPKCDCAELASRYAEGLEAVLGLLRGIGRGGLPREAIGVLEQAESYLKDSRFYLSKGRGAVALASVAYAEGLLDALRLLGLVDFEWPRTGPSARGQPY